MKNTREGILIYDTEEKIYDIRFGLEEYYGGIHCGTCFEVNVRGRWVPVRIETADPETWYLVGLPHTDLNGLQVRI